MPKVVGVENGSIASNHILQSKRGITYGQKDFKITYLVLGDTLDDLDTDISATTGIPSLFYPSFGAYCKSKSIKEETRIIHPVTGVPAGLWSVECMFDNSVDPQDDDNNSGNNDPTSKRPRVSWTGENEDQHLRFDTVTGEAPVNGCNEPIFVTRPEVMPILSIKRFEYYPFDPTVMLEYSNRTNSTPFWGAPKGSALMLPMEVSEDVVIGNVRYVEVTYRIKFNMLGTAATGYNEDTWELQVLHQGTKYRPTPGDAPVVARKNGQPVTINLKANGTRLPDGDPLEYIFISRFYQANFNNLSLGPF